MGGGEGGRFLPHVTYMNVAAAKSMVVFLMFYVSKETVRAEKTKVLIPFSLRLSSSKENIFEKEAGQNHYCVCEASTLRWARPADC